MRRRIIIVIIILLGAFELVYPSLSNYLAERNGSRVIENYETEVSELDDAALRAAWEEAEVYNQNLTGSPVHDPFLPGSGMAMPEDYQRVLNIGGVMAYVDIPKINVYLPVFHGTSEEVLDKGVGHLEGSTLPIGGLGRHAVLTGHTGLTHAKLFTDIIELREGDLFYIHVLDKTLAYQVDQIKVIEPQVTDDLGRIAGGDYCTLLTCTPYGVNSHRLLVRGSRVEYDPGAHDGILAVPGSRIDNMVLRAALITAGVMAVLIVISYFYNRRKHEQAKRVSRHPHPEGRRHPEGRQHPAGRRPEEGRPNPEGQQPEAGRRLSEREAREQREARIQRQRVAAEAKARQGRAAARKAKERQGRQEEPPERHPGSPAEPTP